MAAGGAGHQGADNRAGGVGHHRQLGAGHHNQDVQEGEPHMVDTGNNLWG